MMSKTKIRAWSLLLLVTIAFTACGGGATPEPTIDPNSIYTQAAATVQAQLTMTAAAMPTNTPTPPPTETPQPTPTEAATPTTPPLPTPQGGLVPTLPNVAAPGAVTATSGFAAGDKARFISQVPSDIKGPVVFNPRKFFSIFWTIQNIGSITWTTEYYWAYLSGCPLSAVYTVKLERQVKPGEKYEFAYAAIAPLDTSCKRTNWGLKSPSGYIVPGSEVYLSYKIE